MNQQQRAALASRYQSDGMSGSSPQKLLLAVFDRLGKDLETAKGAIMANRTETAHRALINAQELVFELNLALEPEVWPAANELRSVYEHLHALLVEANLHKSVDRVERCLGIVTPLADGWAEAHRSLQQQGVVSSVGSATGGPEA